jgi:hypothetical protein
MKKRKPITFWQRQKQTYSKKKILDKEIKFMYAVDNTLMIEVE